MYAVFEAEKTIHADNTSFKSLWRFAALMVMGQASQWDVSGSVEVLKKLVCNHDNLIRLIDNMISPCLTQELMASAMSCLGYDYRMIGQHS